MFRKNNKVNRKKSYKGTLWIIAVVLFLIATHILFKIDAPWEWLIPVWEADSFITFIGTITLGLVAIYQNIQANSLNANMQKLEEARFVSMIALKEQKSNYNNGKFSNPSSDYKDAEDINLMDIDKDVNESEKALLIYTEFHNNSDYPIVAITSYIGKPSIIAQKYFKVNAVIDKPIYISERGNRKLKFSLPYNHLVNVLKTQETKSVAISLFFENIFGYRTRATLFIFLEGKNIKSQYRLAKFVDVKPDSDIKE